MGFMRLLIGACPNCFIILSMIILILHFMENPDPSSYWTYSYIIIGSNHAQRVTLQGRIMFTSKYQVQIARVEYTYQEIEKRARK
jgi:hypothetical protein